MPALRSYADDSGLMTAAAGVSCRSTLGDTLTRAIHSPIQAHCGRLGLTAAVRKQLPTATDVDSYFMTQIMHKELMQALRTVVS
jgi:hypothetical protein